MQKPTPKARPLSPHLQIYRLPLLAVLSILHRLTGLALAAGAVWLVAWFAAAASGGAAFAQVQGFTASLPGGCLLFLVSAAFFYHLCNGIRHLFWDAGKGFALSTARGSGRAAVAASLVLTALLWLAILG